MRKGLSVVLTLVLFLAFPIGVSAQGWFGGMLGSDSQGSACCAPCEPWCPSLLKLDVGYLFGDRGVQIGHTVSQDNISGDGTFIGTSAWKSQWRVQGVQLGATVQVPLKDDVGVLLRGTWLFPNNSKAGEVYTLHAPSPPGGEDFPVDWGTRIQYYTVDGAAVYPVCAPFNVLGGFRYDSLFADLKDPSFGELNFLSADKAQRTINEFIPYVGVAMNYGTTARVSLIGTPILWGNIKFQETFGQDIPASFEYRAILKNGYFLEAGAEYALNIGCGTACLLAKWTYLHAVGTPTVHANAPGEPNGDEGKLSIDLIRQNVLLAAQFNVPFTSPW